MINLGYKGAGCLVFHYDTKTHRVSVLLGKRQSGLGAGEWSIAGGGWEKRDGLTPKGKINFKKTATRELYEELFLRTPKDYTLNKIWSVHYPFFDFEVYAIRLSKKKFLTRWAEFRKVAWFDINNLPKNTYSLVYKEIDGLINLLKKKGYKLAEGGEYGESRLYQPC